MAAVSLSASERRNRDLSGRIYRAFRRTGRMALCRGCFERFEPTNRKHALYCSRECYFREKKAKGGWQRLRAVEARVLPRIPCRACGEEFQPSHPLHVFCSDQCRTTHAREWYRKQQGSACLQCGAPRTGDLFFRYCSEACRVAYAEAQQEKIKQTPVYRRMRSDHARRRRARLRAALTVRFRSIDIYERAGWRCQRCGCRCPRTYDAHDPKSPTLDHIIPLAKGGAHTPENCQLLCMRCNGIKRDASGGEQLRLIG